MNLNIVIEDLSEDRIVTEADEDMMMNAIDVLADTLLRGKVRKMAIDIVIDDDCFDEGADGWCETNETKRKPRYFTITLGSHLWQYKERGADVFHKEMLTTLAHEMVHVAQLATGMMHYKDAENVEYETRLYKLSECKYDDRPWEQEAFALQDALYNLCV